MNKKELIDVLHDDTGVYTATVKQVVDALFWRIHRELVNGRDVNVAGFGKFHVVTRAAKLGRNPATGGTMSLPERRMPKFAAAKALKDAVK